MSKPLDKMKNEFYGFQLDILTKKDRYQKEKEQSPFYKYNQFV